jgi:hypothetical protein
MIFASRPFGLTRYNCHLTARPGRFITVLGEAPMGWRVIAITMDEAPLVKAMRSYSSGF